MDAMNRETKKKYTEYNNKLTYQKFSQLTCISINCVYDYNELDGEKKELISRISRVDYSKTFNSKLFDTPCKYIEHMYKTLNLEKKLYRWLIPMFGTSNNCYEISINDISLFCQSYFHKDGFCDFLAFDLDNEFLFNICIGETEMEYFIINYKVGENRD